MLGPTTFHDAPVIEAWDETSAFRGIRLAFPAPLAGAHAHPGQVVKIRTAFGEGFFALASAPGQGRAELLVKRGGRIADAIVAQARPGQSLRLTQPFGNGFPVDAAAGKDALLFAAGSGIAPVRALVQHIIADRQRFNRVTLFYGQRHGADFAYRGEMLGWERGGVRVVLCPSRADDVWEGVRGRVQQVASALSFAGSRLGETFAFVSGMAAMVEDVRRTLAEAGVPLERVYSNF